MRPEKLARGHCEALPCIAAEAKVPSACLVTRLLHHTWCGGSVSCLKG